MYPYFRIGMDPLLTTSETTTDLYQILYRDKGTLIVVEGMGDLIHNIVRMLEKAKNTIVQLNTHIVSVLLKTK